MSINGDIITDFEYNHVNGDVDARVVVTRRNRHCAILAGSELKIVGNDSFYYALEMESRVENGYIEVKNTYAPCIRKGYRRASDRKIVTDNFPMLVEMSVLPSGLVNPSLEIIKEYGLEQYFK